MRHFVHVRLLGSRKYQVFVLNSCNRPMILGRRIPKDPVAVEPSFCPSKFQDLAEPETQHAEAKYASIFHMRAVTELKFCSISANAAILAEKVLTICSILVILDVRRTSELEMVWMSATFRTSGSNTSRITLSLTHRQHGPREQVGNNETGL